MWIHEENNWPKFIWNAETLAGKLADVRHRQGFLLGRMSSLGFDLRREASLNILTTDVVNSSAIEGENLNSAEVRSSIARRLGIDIAGLRAAKSNVEGIVEMMLDATQQFVKPLTKERLCAWHAALFPTAHSGIYKITVGDWRPATAGQMQVISCVMGNEKVHFEAPSAEKLENEMRMFLIWFNNNIDIDPVLKAGIAHFWFVTIHPFEDGNGRIARAICDMALARADGMPERFYSLSTQIEVERQEYYKQLEKQQRNSLDITCWLDWFLGCLGRAISKAEQTLHRVLWKAHLWEKINKHLVNERQRLVIERMLEESFQGYINTSKYAKLAKCSNDTALRDIRELKSQGVFMQNLGGGRSTSYKLTE